MAPEQMPPPFVGAVVLRVADGAVTEAGRITHAGHSSVNTGDPSYPSYAPGIQRSFVVGDALYTFSDAGILASDLSSLAERAWAGF